MSDTIRIEVDKNLVLFYADGRLASVRKPLDDVSIFIDLNGNKEYFINGKYYNKDNYGRIYRNKTK